MQGLDTPVSASPVVRRGVVITRPAPDAQDWARALELKGVSTLVLPVLAFGPPPDAWQGQLLWAHLTRYQAIMAVSAQAARAFLSLRPAVVSPEWSTPPWLRWWVTGKGTGRALAAGGVAEHQIQGPDEQATPSDSESLWKAVRDTVGSGHRVLILRGGDASGEAHGRAWLADQLRAQGVLVDEYVAYVRHWPDLDQAVRFQVEQQLGLPPHHSPQPAQTVQWWWFFTSSDAVRRVVALFPQVDWQQSRAVATHPRIAEVVRAAGFGVVRVSQPGLNAMLASIE